MLASSVEILKKAQSDTAQPSLNNLRQELAATAMKKLGASVQEAMTPELHNALLYALRGQQESSETLLRCMMEGFLQFDHSPSLVPSIAPSLVWQLATRVGLSELPATQLLHLCKDFLYFDYPSRMTDPLDDGRTFEMQLRSLWKIRCLAFATEFVSYELGILLPGLQPVASDSFRMTMIGLLGGPAEEQQQEQQAGGLVAPGLWVTGELFSRLLDVAARPDEQEQRQVNTNDSQADADTIWPANTVWSPPDPQDQGYADHRSMAPADGPNHSPLHFIFHCKWAGEEAEGEEEAFNLNTVADSIVNTCVRHSTLHKVICEGRFAFVFLAGRRFVRPLACSEDLCELGHLLETNVQAQLQAKWPNPTPVQQTIIQNAAKNLAMLDIHAVKRLLTPTLARSPFFVFAGDTFSDATDEL